MNNFILILACLFILYHLSKKTNGGSLGPDQRDRSNLGTNSRRCPPCPLPKCKLCPTCEKCEKCPKCEKPQECKCPECKKPKVIKYDNNPENINGTWHCSRYFGYYRLKANSEDHCKQMCNTADNKCNAYAFNNRTKDCVGYNRCIPRKGTNWNYSYGKKITNP